MRLASSEGHWIGRSRYRASYDKPCRRGIVAKTHAVPMARANIGRPTPYLADRSPQSGWEPTLSVNQEASALVEGLPVSSCRERPLKCSANVLHPPVESAVGHLPFRWELRRTAASRVGELTLPTRSGRSACKSNRPLRSGCGHSAQRSHGQLPPRCGRSRPNKSG
jgi:hypothetical protein